MDINYLLQREQVERARATRAPAGLARQAHCEMADAYRDLIDDYRRDRLDAAGLGPGMQPPRL
jgi:hypothetical protein